MIQKMGKRGRDSLETSEDRPFKRSRTRSTSNGEDDSPILEGDGAQTSLVLQ